MTPKTRNRLAALFILAFPFMVALGFLISEAIRPLPPLPPLPNPNGYEKFMKAGQMTHGQAGLYDSMSQVELRMLVASNAEALTLARAGFTNECRVPVQFSQFYGTNHIRDLIGFRNLAQTLAAEGRLAELENRPNDAAKSYLDAVHLGNEVARGGVLIDAMIGVAIEGLGTSCLQKIPGELDAKSCRETAAALESFDTNRQSWVEVMRQGDLWRSNVHPGLRNYIVMLFMHNTLSNNKQKAEQTFKERQQQMRQLLIDLATRAYELDKGQRPASLADLEPDYLKAIPQDPFTGANMVYSPR
jgi:hypothetical protein